MNLAVIGSGYVGLVSAICFAKIGHNVTVIDIDEHKITSLKKGLVPIFEPGLEDLLHSKQIAQKISFTTSLKESLKNSQAIFIAVGTPQSDNENKANLEYVYQVAKDIALNCEDKKFIITKSTVPVGTGKEIAKIIKKNNSKLEFSIISNPEFLREGKAIGDFLHPERIVVGVNNNDSKEIMLKIYQPLIDLNKNPDLIIFTDVTTSELIKYGANAFLATKIAFINEMANLCTKVGADIKDFAKGIGSDSRIGDKFLQAGPGFGGSCFPKDILALMDIANNQQVNLNIIENVIKSNDQRKFDMVDLISKILGDNVKDKNITILGLAFKGDTDDIRHSPAIFIVKELLKKGAKIRAYDPKAIKNCKFALGDNPNISYFDNYLDAVKNSEILVIATEWQQFSYMDLSKIKQYMKNPVIADLRNMINIKEAKDLNFDYFGIGTKLYKTHF